MKTPHLWFFPILFIVLLSACSSPLTTPEAKASIIGARSEAGTEGAAAVLNLRVSVVVGLAVESFGLTVKASSGIREYWKTEVFQERIPPGASAVVEMRLGFAGVEESYVEGSAVIDSSWFE